MSSIPSSMMPLSLSAYANPGSFNGIQLPTLTPPTFAAPNVGGSQQSVQDTLLQNQNLANQQNQQLYQSALNTEANGYNNQQASIQQAMQADQGYGQAQLSQLGTQLQQNLGSNTSSNVSRGLSNTSAAFTSQAPILNNYNQAVAGVNNQAANLQAGLQSNLASSQIQGANSLANLIGSRTDQAPSASAFASLNQAANSGTGQIQGFNFNANPTGTGTSMGGMSSSGMSGAPGRAAQSGAGGNASGSNAPSYLGGNSGTSDFLTSDSGGGQSVSTGNLDSSGYNGQYSPLGTDPGSMFQGYGGLTDGYDGGMLTGDTSGSNMGTGSDGTDNSGQATTPTSQLGLQGGEFGGMPAQSPAPAAQAPAAGAPQQGPTAPASISSAMQPQQNNGQTYGYDNGTWGMGSVNPVTGYFEIS